MTIIKIWLKFPLEIYNPLILYILHGQDFVKSSNRQLVINDFLSMISLKIKLWAQTFELKINMLTIHV